MSNSPNIPSPQPPGRRIFVPIVAGAKLCERLIAGALVGVLLTGMISGSIFGGGANLKQPGGLYDGYRYSSGLIRFGCFDGGIALFLGREATTRDFGVVGPAQFAQRINSGP